MDAVRKELMPGVTLTCVRATKFKTGLLSAQLIAPLEEKTAAAGALFPAVLDRGTTRCPDMASLSAALDRLYGASAVHTVRKKGENRCLGFVAGFIDDKYALAGEKLLEPMAEMLGELLLDPVTRSGRFLSDYVESEKTNLIDAIRAVRDDKRDWADKRMLEEMCRGERYGIPLLGTEEGMRRCNNQTLYRFYRTVLQSAQVELFYCGSAEMSRVEDALARPFASLPRGGIVPPVPAERKSAPETPRCVVEHMDVTQGKLAMGFRAESRDIPALMLMNLIFGGYSNSKLFLNVREKLSLCYYASSSFHRSKSIITVSSGVDFDRFETARDAILAELAAICRGEIEPWELEGARGVLISAIRQQQDSAGYQEDLSLFQAATGLWTDELALMGELAAVTPDRIAEAAQSVKLDTVYFLTGQEDTAHD